VLKHSDIVTLDLLLNLQDVHVSGEFLDLTSTDCIDQARLTDTIPADQAILAALDEPQCGVFEQSLATNDNVDALHGNVLLEAIALVVAALGRGDALLMAHKLGHFLV